MLFLCWVGFLKHVRDSVIDHVRNVVVGEAIERFSPGTLDRDDPQPTQRAEVLRNQGLRHPSDRDKCCHGTRSGRELPEQPQPGFRAECFEKLCGRSESLFVFHNPSSPHK